MTAFDERAFDALRRDADEVSRVRQRAAKVPTRSVVSANVPLSSSKDAAQAQVMGCARSCSACCRATPRP